MSKRASPAIIGAFVVVGFALVLIAIVILSGGRWFRHTAHVIVYFDSSVVGLRVGAPVKFRGIEIGTVKDQRISMTGAVRDPQHVPIPVVLEIDEDRLSAQGIASIDLDDASEVRRLVGLGLRAELATESLVTGVRYVELDIKPGAPAHLVHDPRYPEIPSVPSVTETIPDRVDQVLRNLAQVDVAGLARSMRATVDDADQLVRSPHLARAVASLDKITANLDRAVNQLSTAAQDLGPAIAEARDTVASARKTSDRLSNHLDTTLRDVGGAARSLRRLADQLGRDPGALLRGGKP
ncbi:MAG TPA: MlaD family protein [Kofleriaceae bacterium]|jgi:paraquat-inducible protein B|nr:MlaD family protein [Kofleriaceae bacterium]